MRCPRPPPTPCCSWLGAAPLRRRDAAISGTRFGRTFFWPRHERAFTLAWKGGTPAVRRGETFAGDPAHLEFREEGELRLSGEASRPGAGMGEFLDTGRLAAPWTFPMRMEGMRRLEATQP